MKQQINKEICVGLEFGTSLNVQLEGIGAAKTTIIGLERDKFLLIKPPALSGLEAMLFQKNKTTITYLHEGTIYGFRCTLIGLIKTPFPLVILSYPEASEELNLRKHKRLSCLLNGEVTISGASFRIIIRDISLSGCRLIIPDLHGHTEVDMSQLYMGCRIRIQADMKNEIDDTVLFSAVVKNLQRGRKGLIIGTEFDKRADQYDALCMDKLKRYIAIIRETLMA